MNFMDAVKTAFSRYVDFQGRSRRSEFWWFALFNFILSAVANVIDASIGIPILSVIVLLVLIIPGIAVSIRRLHDLDKSGWWLFIGLIPIVGAILLIVWYATEGTKGDNRFGADPLAA